MISRLSVPLRVVVVMIFTLVVVACSFGPFSGHDDLTLERRFYDGNALRLDGYYYYTYGTSEGERHNAYFFYRDGTVRYGGNSPTLDTLESEVNLYGDVRRHWGLFEVNGDTIAFERWYPSSGAYSPAFIRSGQIINDTTFVITETRRSGGGDQRTVDEMYRFRAFEPKPDSTSRFLD